MAELNADSRLAVNVVKDPSNETCTFYVSMPPGDTAAGPVQEIFRQAEQVKNASDAFDTAKNDFTPVLVKALLMPLERFDLNNEEKKEFVDSLNARGDLISNCVVESLLKNAPFRELDKEISCGTIDGGDFLIEASFENDLSFALYLPL